MTREKEMERATAPLTWYSPAHTPLSPFGPTSHLDSIFCSLFAAFLTASGFCDFFLCLSTSSFLIICNIIPFDIFCLSTCELHTFWRLDVFTPFSFIVANRWKKDRTAHASRSNASATMAESCRCIITPDMLCCLKDLTMHSVN